MTQQVEQTLKTEWIVRDVLGTFGGSPLYVLSFEGELPTDRCDFDIDEAWTEDRNEALKLTKDDALKLVGALEEHSGVDTDGIIIEPF